MIAAATPTVEPGGHPLQALFADFKKFLIRGNLVTLAVAFMVGTVFAALIKALIDDIVTPIIGLIFGKPDFSALSFSINSSRFLYGDFVNALVTFVTTAAAVFFLVVKPYEIWSERRPQTEPSIKACPECYSEINIKATRCPFCTAALPAARVASSPVG